MTRSDVIRRLQRIEPMLRARGVAALYLFGSYARNEAGPASDVDLFIDTEDTSFGLDRYAETYALVEAALPGVPVGYSTREAIVPLYRSGIERDAVQVF